MSCFGDISDLLFTLFTFAPLFVVPKAKSKCAPCCDDMSTLLITLFTLASLPVVFAPTQRSGTFVAVQLLSTMWTNARRCDAEFCEAFFAQVGPTAV